MSAHTRGPWSVGEMRHKYDIVIRDTDGAPVALVAIAGYTLPEGEANARLIAAAPELLEALKLTLEAVCLAGWEGDFSAEKARAAIAKAEGKQ